MAEGEENLQRPPDPDPDPDLEETFNGAAVHLESLVAQLDSGQLLGFYGLYKQATCGSCNVSRPNYFKIQAKQKWEAWKSLGDMSRQVAMGSYIRAVGKLDPSWEEDARAGSRTWVAVSRLPNTDTELRDIDKTLLDWIKDSDEQKVWETISKGSNDKSMIHEPDESGMQPIHWAADRGHVPIIGHLIEAGADKNVKDSDGQTPLHYAASCGHAEAVKYFLSIGAEIAEDNDGMTPKDVASQDLLSMF